MFGSPEVTAGGNALKFYASVRMDIRRIAAIKDGDGQTIGNRTRVKIVKNKVSPPFRETEFDMMYGQGICRYGELIEIGKSSPGNFRTVENLDFSDLDTVVIPAQEDGFKEVFLGENRWYKIRISSSMIPK